MVLVWNLTSFKHVAENLNSPFFKMLNGIPCAYAWITRPLELFIPFHQYQSLVSNFKGYFKILLCCIRLYYTCIVGWSLLTVWWIKTQCPTVSKSAQTHQNQLDEWRIRIQSKVSNYFLPDYISHRKLKYNSLRLGFIHIFDIFRRTQLKWYYVLIGQNGVRQNLDVTA